MKIISRQKSETCGTVSSSVQVATFSSEIYPTPAPMAPSATAADSSVGNSQSNDLQPIFVLHRAASNEKSERKPTRRKLDSSSAEPANYAGLDVLERGDGVQQQLRQEAFKVVWSKIESTIKGVLENINATAYNQILSWVLESFRTIRSFGSPGFSEATKSFPITTNPASKRLFTGLVLTKNIEFVDDQMTFEELAKHLRANGCHVANLSSSDFSAKDGIGISLKSLLRQFLAATADAADLSILSSWYHEQGSYSKPVVIIINDLERCSGSVLSDFIIMLSEWVVKIPVILVMGVATTLDVPRNILRSSTLQCLCPCKFTLQSPVERMDAVLDAVLVQQFSGFFISHKVASFMRDYFVNQDGTLSSFVRALKMACAHHFFAESSSYMLKSFADGDIQGGNRGSLPDAVPKIKMDDGGQKLVQALSELKRMHGNWSIAVQCLHEAAKLCQIRFLDLVCEALDPELYRSRESDGQNQSNLDPGTNLSRKRNLIDQAIRKVRSLPEPLLRDLLKGWEKFTLDVHEVHDKEDLQYMLNFDGSKRVKEDFTETRRRGSRNHLSVENPSKALNEKCAAFLESLINDHLQPLECLPSHEVVCFKNVDNLQAALAGDPRRQIQVDILGFHKVLRCSCCKKNDTTPLPSMPDSAIIYFLSQEHSDLINLYNWYQSFKSVLSHQPVSKEKQKMKQKPKKKKNVGNAEALSEVSIQARFCRAVTELQITGLIRMQSKRRPDFVQRVAFGL